MKLMLGVAAAALLCSAADSMAASANLSFSLYGVTCHATVANSIDRKHGVKNPVLLIGTSDDCGFSGTGVTGRTAFSGRPSKGKSIATVTGISPYIGSGQILVTVFLDYPFVTGGKYTAYDYDTDPQTTDHKQHWVVSGTYTVTP